MNKAAAGAGVQSRRVNKVQVHVYGLHRTSISAFQTKHVHPLCNVSNTTSGSVCRVVFLTSRIKVFMFSYISSLYGYILLTICHQLSPQSVKPFILKDHSTPFFSANRFCSA